MYEEKAEYLWDLDTTDQKSRAKHIMEAMHNKVLNYDTAGIYYSMLEELLEYLNRHGKRVIMALPVTLKDMPYSYLTFEPENITYGLLFDTRTIDSIPEHAFLPKPPIYVIGLYQEYADRDYLMPRYEKPFEHPAQGKIFRTDNGFKIYYTHGRRDIEDQVVMPIGDTIIFNVVDSGTIDTCYSTTPYFRQNHHIYVLEADGDGNITGTGEITGGDDDSPSYTCYTPDNNANERISYLFYRRNGKELCLSYRDVVMPDSKLISGWDGRIYGGSDSISYAAVYRGTNDTVFVAFVVHSAGSDDELHVLKFYRDYHVINDEIIFHIESSGGENEINNPVFIKGDAREGIEFILLFSVRTGGENAIVQATYRPRGWDKTDKLTDYRVPIKAMKGASYMSTYVLGVLGEDSVYRVLHIGTVDRRLKVIKDIVMDSMVNSFDMVEYGGVFYTAYEKTGYDTLNFDTCLPDYDGEYHAERITLYEKFPHSDIVVRTLKTDLGTIELSDNMGRIVEGPMLFCRTPLMYLDTANARLRVWYNYGGYGTYVIKDREFNIKPSVTLRDYPNVIQYGSGFSISFKGYPAGDNEDASGTIAAISRYHVILKENGVKPVWDTTIEVYDTIPRTHSITTAIVNDRESSYTVEIIAHSISSYTDTTKGGPIYGRFIKISRLLEGNRRWMVSGMDTMYMGEDNKVRKFDLNTRMQIDTYVLNNNFLTHTALANMSEEIPLSGYYLNYEDPRKDTSDTGAGGEDVETTGYYALTHLIFGDSIIEEIDNFSSELKVDSFISGLTRVYKDIMFYVIKPHPHEEYYKYYITSKDTTGQMVIDERRYYLETSTRPSKPTMVTHSGRVYIAYETDSNTIRLDITDMSPRLLESYTFSGRLPRLTIIDGYGEDDSIVLYYVEETGSIGRAALVDTAITSEDRIYYNGNDSITYLGVHQNSVVITDIERIDEVSRISSVKYLEDTQGGWSVRKVDSSNLSIDGVPRREFIMPQVFRVNDTFIVLSYLEKVTWNGKTEYGGWIKLYNPETGNIQTGIIALKTGLYGIYPNPGNGVFKIMYGLRKKMRVRIMVYDVSGRRVRTIENRIKKPGVYTVIWNGRDRDGRMLPSGIYIVNIKIGSFYRKSKKIVLTR